MSRQNLPEQNVEALFNAISQIIEQARNTVYRTVNFAMVQAYWKKYESVILILKRTRSLFKVSYGVIPDI